MPKKLTHGAAFSAPTLQFIQANGPFGTRKRMKVYIESTIFDLPKIYINAGHRGICAAMSPEWLEKVLPETERVTVAID